MEEFRETGESSQSTPPSGVCLTEEAKAASFLIDEMINEDPNVKMHGIRGIPAISLALGPRRTREELIPFITKLIDDDDEVLLVLMEELFKLVIDPRFMLNDEPHGRDKSDSAMDHEIEAKHSSVHSDSQSAITEHKSVEDERLDGHSTTTMMSDESVIHSHEMSKEDTRTIDVSALDERHIQVLRSETDNQGSQFHLTRLLPAFERLCSVEEKVIRDDAVSKTGEIIRRVPLFHRQAFECWLLPFLSRLVDCEWHSGRISGALLCEFAWMKLVRLQRSLFHLVFFSPYFDTLPLNDDSVDEDEAEKEEEESHDSIKQQPSSKMAMLRLLEKVVDHKIEVLKFMKRVTQDNIPIVRRCILDVIRNLCVNCYTGIHQASSNSRRINNNNVSEDDESTQHHQKTTLDDCLCIQSSVLVSDQQTRLSGGVCDIIDDLLPLFNDLCRDEQDNVKVFAVESLCSMIEVFAQGNHILNLSQKPLGLQFGSLLKRFTQLNLNDRRMVTDPSMKSNNGTLEELNSRCELFCNQMKQTKDRLFAMSDDLSLLFYRTDIESGISLSDSKKSHSLMTYQRTIDLIKRLKLYSRIRELCTDDSWRVRYVCAQKIRQFIQHLSSDLVLDSLVDLYIALLTDSEAEVRACAVSHIDYFAHFLGSGVLWSEERLVMPSELEYTQKECRSVIDSRLTMSMIKCANDSNKYVRASVASVIIPFCRNLSLQMVLDCKLLSCILSILKDEFPNVRLEIIRNVCQFEDGRKASEMVDFYKEKEQLPLKKKTDKSEEEESEETKKQFGIEMIQESLIPSIVELTLDRDWRVRLSIVETFPFLALRFGREFFDSQLLGICLGSLQDCVAEIRLSAAKQVFEIAKIYHDLMSSSSVSSKSEGDNGGDQQMVSDHREVSPSLTPWLWVGNVLLDRLKEMCSKSTNYLHRIVILKVYTYLSEGIGKSGNVPLVVEIDSMLEDPVPNVRFKACQSIKTLSEKSVIDEATLANVRLQLSKMTTPNESDIDVVFFAQKALSAVDKRLAKIDRKRKRDRARAERDRARQQQQQTTVLASSATTGSGGSSVSK